MKKEVAHKTTYGYFYKEKPIKRNICLEMTYWKVDGKVFNTLKEAKEYIDKITT